MGAKKQSGTKRKAQDVSQQAEVKTHVDKALAQKAVSALLQYHAKQQDANDSKNQLPMGDDDRPIHVQFGLERASNPNSFKPMRIMIPNPIHLLQNTTSDNTSTSMDGLEEPEVCLIVKDSAKAWIQEMRFSPELAKELKMVKKVLTLTDVRQKYARYHQRRELLHLYNVFMADDRILPMLTAALGKDFVKAKKLPLPLRVTQNGLPFAIRNNLSSTFLTVGGGTSVSVRAGTTAMPEQKLVENILAVAEGAGDKLPRAWANIRTIAIKTPESTSLPLYHCLPQELQEIAEQAGIDEKKKMEEEEEAKATKENVADSAAMNSPLVKALKKRKKEGSAKKEAKEERKTDAESSAKKEKKRTMKEKEDASPKAEKKEGSAKKAKKDGSAKKEKKKEDASPKVEKTPQGSAKKEKKDESAKKEKKKDSPKGGSARKEKKDSSAKKDRKKKRSLSQ